MRRLITLAAASILSVGAFGLSTGTASATPLALSNVAAPDQASPLVETVRHRWRHHRHWGWRHGPRRYGWYGPPRRYGWYGPRRYGWYGPGYYRPRPVITFGIGPGYYGGW